MATLSKGYNFASGETNITATKLNNLVDNATISNIVGTDLANGAVDLAGTKVTGILPKTNGGTGINASSLTDLFNQLDPLTTKGDVVAHDGSNSVRVPIGTNGQILTADSTVAAGLKWAAAPSGGSSPTTTKGDLIVNSGSGDVRLPVGTDTFVLTADSSIAVGVKWAAAPSGGGGGGGGDALAAGTVVPFSGSSVPTGWLLCDGSAVSRSTYSDLFSAIGTTYGVGDGSTTFNVPDLRGRAPIGKDNMGGTAANRITSGGSGITGTTLGASGGEETHTLTIAEMPAHTHNTTGALHSNYGGATVNGNDNSQTKATSSTGGGGAHNNTQPSLVLNYIIKHTAMGSGGGPNTTKGDITVHNGTTNVRLPVGADNAILTADASQALGVKWATSLGGSSALTFNKFQVFDSSGTWSNPDKVTKVYAQVWGAGGSGGGSTNTTGNNTPSATGAGGGAGGYTAGIVNITPDPQSVTVSGSSTFAGLTANQGSSGGANGGQGGTGGTASGGTVIINGATGGGGAAVGSGIAGMGGTAGMGGGGGGGGSGTGGSATNGRDGQTPGGGGGGAGGGNGALGDRSGGSGGGGRVILWWNEPTVGTGVDNLEAGTVVPFAGSTAPNNWLLCDGSAVSRTTYAILFGVLGTTFGSGDGSTTFNLPDLRGRVPAGRDNMGGTSANRLTSGGSGITGSTLGAAGGVETYTMTTNEMPSHTHQLSGLGYQPGGQTNPKSLMPAGQTSNGTLQSTDAAGGGAAHQNTQPSIILNYIIKYTGGGSSGGIAAVSTNAKAKNILAGTSLTTVLSAVPSGKSQKVAKLTIMNTSTSAVTFDLEISDGTTTVLLEDDFTLGPRSKVEYTGITIPNNGTSGTLKVSCNTASALYVQCSFEEGSNSSLKGKVYSVPVADTDVIATGDIASGKVGKFHTIYIHNTQTTGQTYNLSVVDGSGGTLAYLAFNETIGSRSSAKFENIYIPGGGRVTLGNPGGALGNIVAVLGYEEVAA